MDEPLTVAYARHPTRKGLRELCADVWLPERRPADLLVWMHSGGFRVGSRQHRAHAELAAEFGRRGIGFAAIDYRLSRPIAVLSAGSEAALPLLLADAEGSDLAGGLIGRRALAAVEDACAFLRFARDRRRDWGLSGRFMLGGSSAGAITALNTLWLPPVLGVRRPRIATVLAFSGAFAYPSHRLRTGARILALHSPRDRRVPATSLRRLAAENGPDDDLLHLIEDETHAHGELRLTPRETLRAAVRRCVAFHRAGLSAPALAAAPAPVTEPQPQEVPCSTMAA